MSIPVTVRGEPLLAEVTYYHPGEPAFGLYPGVPEEFEIELYTPRGNRAEWFESTLTNDDWYDIEDQVRAWRREQEEKI